MFGEKVRKTYIMPIWVIFILGFKFVNSDHPCYDYNGITEYEVEAVIKEWPVHLNLASVNRTHKCYVACIFYYYNLVGTSGKITLDEYFDSGIIDEYAFAPTLNRCRYEYREEKDFCEHTFGIFHCFRQERLHKNN
ncbi:general odorant-binding protein 57d isoform X1 [Drosophila eugracilis]|uniref:general odorant-binding protein 57d isoform X1 n=1 Tax=Drosophila eugracilis TaxID=29029 RepID=UPI0007E66F63|nr:general odorant-binding protein 57d isoform X1 [Drosophila eugracilis]